MVSHSFSHIGLVRLQRKITKSNFFRRAALFSPVSGYFHVSGHLFSEQRPVVITLLLHLLPQIDLLAIHFIYSLLETNTYAHTDTEAKVLLGKLLIVLNKCTDLL